MRASSGRLVPLDAVASLGPGLGPLTVYGFVGMMMLVGVVKKNPIMMIDVALEAECAGVSSAEAIYRGCLLRFRPLGLAVVRGLAVSQLLALHITPVLYLYMEAAQKALARHPVSSVFSWRRWRRATLVSADD